MRNVQNDDAIQIFTREKSGMFYGCRTNVAERKNGFHLVQLIVDAVDDLALLKADGWFAPLPIAASRTVNLGGTVATIGFLPSSNRQSRLIGSLRMWSNQRKTPPSSSWFIE